MVKKHLLSAAILAVAAVFSLNPSAQRSHENKGPGGVGSSIVESAPLERLALSHEQRESLKRIDNDYRERTFRKRGLLMVKRLELQSLLRNPSVGKEKIQAKSEEMGALSLVRSMSLDLALIDFKMPGQNGIEVLREAKQLNPELDVIMITAYGNIESAVGAMKAIGYPLRDLVKIFS